MRSNFSLAVALLTAALAPFAPADIASPFNSNAEGWTTYGDAKDFAWDSDTGHAAGSIYAADLSQGIYWGFAAAPKFLGDRSAYIGGDLNWEIWLSHYDGEDGIIDVTLTSSNLTLVIDVPNPSKAEAWAPASAKLAHTAGWKVGTLGGPPATKNQFAQVMADLKALHIRGEYHAGGDNSWLDNVVMSSADCYSDCDLNQTLDLFDFLCFVNAFNEGDAYADCDENGSLDLFDFLCFTNAFNQPCF